MSLTEIASQDESDRETDAANFDNDSTGVGDGEDSPACDFCKTSLIGRTCRAFRCCKCDEYGPPSLQCERCCFHEHLCRRDHTVEVSNFNHIAQSGMLTRLVGVELYAWVLDDGEH